MNAVSRLIRLLDTPPLIAAMTPVLQREIPYHILCSRRGAQLRRLPS
ncbi:MAG: AraC family transcriptional regulator N-terminal domain-containing protein [Bryobacteraceae bacterium]|nr:AraC family transcriptional regulator N-terminal domain-containing protein [Bryobacteraceae bacterium]